MSVSCTSTPTGTTTIVGTTSSLSTSLTTLTSTLSDSTSVSSTTECLLTQNSTCASSTVSSTTTTITGGTTILTNQAVITVPVTTTDISTLFGSSCTTSTTSAGSSISTPPPSPPPPSPPSSQNSTTSTITSLATSTNAQGSTTVFETTVLTVVGANTTAGPPPSVQSDNNGGSGGGGSSGASAHLGAIIGGTVGGVFGLLALILVVWFIIKRRNRWNDIFEHEEAIGDMGAPERRFSLSADLDGEPKPYQYGLVGLPGSVPPHSPPLRATESTYSDERGRPSISPLNLPAGAVATGLQIRTPSATSVSRPSTAGSIQPLTNNGRPLSQHGPQGPSYPPGMQQYYQQQEHSRAHSTTTTSHSTSPSLSQAPMQPVPGWMMNIGPQSELSPRAGSPVSYQEPRRLHVANLRDSTSSPPILDGSPGSPTAAHRPSMSISSFAEPVQADGKGRMKTSGSGNVLVHTDGGRVQQPGPSNVGAIPPVYTEQ